MIRQVQAAITADIQASIKDNTTGDITGDLLQTKLLLLNRGAFGGEIEYYEDGELVRLDIAELQDCINANYVDDGSTWGKFLKEFKANNYQEFHYVALWNYVGGVARIEAYLLLYTNYRAEEGYSGPVIEMYFLMNPSWHINNLQSIALVEENDWGSTYFIGAVYADEPRKLNMYLGASASYSTFNELFSALQISGQQWEEIGAGRYAFVRNTRTGEILPIMQMEHLESGQSITVGYRTWDGAHYWQIIDDGLTDTHSITLTDI